VALAEWQRTPADEAWRRTGPGRPLAHGAPALDEVREVMRAAKEYKGRMA
jgi:hypothetical protein